MKMVSIYNVGNAVLLAHAQTVLGLPVDESTPHKALIAQVIAVSGSKEIPAPDGASEVSKDVVAPAKANATATDSDSRTVRLIISKQAGAGGDEDVPLGVNGSFMLVRRGITQDVPMAYFRVLEAAVMDVFEPLENGGISTTPNKVPIYPYTVQVAH